MERVGIDVYKKQSQICLLAEAGELVHMRIHTDNDAYNRHAQKAVGNRQ